MVTALSFTGKWFEEKVVKPAQERKGR